MSKNKNLEDTDDLSPTNKKVKVDLDNNGDSINMSKRNIVSPDCSEPASLNEISSSASEQPKTEVNLENMPKMKNVSIQTFITLKQTIEIHNGDLLMELFHKLEPVEEGANDADLLRKAIEVCISNYWPVSQLAELVEQLNLARPLDVPEESVLVDYCVLPIYEETMAHIRKSITGEKIFVAMFQRKFDDLPFKFVFVGTLKKDGPGSLFLLNAQKISSGDSGVKLFNDSMNLLWPNSVESHSEDILLFLTDCYDQKSTLGKQLRAYFPKVIYIEGLEKLFNDLKGDYSRYYDHDHESVKYYHGYLNSAINVIRNSETPKLSESIGIIESFFDSFLNWSDKYGKCLYSDVSGDVNIPGYEALVDVSNSLFGTKIESVAYSDDCIDISNLTQEDKQFYRYAPLGGIDFMERFPLFDQFLNDQDDYSIPIEYFDIYSVIYCNQII